MAGPGLLLALAVLARTAGAETAVGLDARGVDPMAAVDNRQGLDVRDELGRPVSAKAVLADLKKAQAARAAEGSFTTALPKAKAVLAALEYGAGAAASVIQLAASLPLVRALASLPAPKPRAVLWLLPVFGAVLAAVSAALPRVLQVSLRPCQRCPEVLRC